MTQASLPDPAPRPPLGRRALRVLGITFGVLMALLVVGVAVVYAASEPRLRRTYNVDPEPIAVRVDEVTIREGRRLATVRGCNECHGANLAGTVMVDMPPLGRIVSSNLTRGRGGVGARYKAADLDRAIRHGVGLDHKPLLLMPSHELQAMSDDELGALAAYIGSLPPVDTRHPESYVGPVGRALLLAGKIPLLPAEQIDHEHPQRAPARGATKEYGAYLAAGCTGCHGPGFSGGSMPGGPPGFPPAANITPNAADGIGRWSRADFARAMRTGRRPDGSSINPAMPWKAYSQLTDEELTALWSYLRTVPAREAGNR